MIFLVIFRLLLQKYSGWQALSSIVSSFKLKLDNNTLSLACQSLGQYEKMTEEEKMYTVTRRFYRSLMEVCRKRGDRRRLKRQKEKQERHMIHFRCAGSSCSPTPNAQRAFYHQKYPTAQMWQVWVCFFVVCFFLCFFHKEENFNVVCFAFSFRLFFCLSLLLFFSLSAKSGTLFFVCSLLRFFSQFWWLRTCCNWLCSFELQPNHSQTNSKPQRY